MPSPPFLSCSQKLEHVFGKLVSMALRDTDKKEFFRWMMNCLREKLQEEVRTDLEPVQLLIRVFVSGADSQ